VYEFCRENAASAVAVDDGEEILSHLSYTKRRIYIGEDSETEYQKSLDSFLRAWYLGNMRFENHTVYKFDIGASYEKDYSKEIPKLIYAAERMTIGTMGFIRLDGLEYTKRRGFGFSTGEGISIVERSGPDLLRQDLVEGENEVEYLVEAPRGQYELLVVSGDSESESVTVLEAVGGRKTGGEILPKGAFSAKLIPVIHENDGCIRLKISTKRGYKWKINAVMLNLYKQF